MQTPFDPSQPSEFARRERRLIVAFVTRIAVACAVLSTRNHAWANSGRFELVWTAPDTCPKKAQVRERIERILNRAITLPDDEVLIVKAEVDRARQERPWRVTLDTDNGKRRATRSLEAASCDELANATALFVAILIEPNIDSAHVEESDDLAASKVNRAPSQVEPSRSAEKRRAPEQAREAVATEPGLDRGVRSDPDFSKSRAGDPRWSLGVTSGLMSGHVPSWSLGFGAYGAFSWKALRTNIGANYWLPTDKTVDDAQTEGATFQLSSAHAEVCLEHNIGQFAPGFCAGAQVARLRAKGFGPAVRTEEQTANFASLSVGGALVYRYSNRLWLLFDADALFALGARRFVFGGSDPATIHQPETGVRLNLGAEFAL